MRHPSAALLPLLALLALSACASARGGASQADRDHVDAMAREHAHDAPVPNAADQAPRQDVVARSVDYVSIGGQPVTGYLVRPTASGSQPIPGIVMVHEWWGLNDNVRTMARRLAGEGYAVLAVDLYHGQTAQTPQEAQRLMAAATEDPAADLGNLRAAAAYLQDEEHAPKIGIIGWCFGGGWSLRGALDDPARIDAAVVYYGQPVTDPAELAKLDAPLLGLYGEADQGIPVARVREMEQQLKQLGKDATFQIYPGAAHAFANPSGTSYRPEAAADAWRRTTEFLGKELK